jgi:hypothetical protein
MHTARRLSVFIEAPQAMIETVIANHAIVRQLVENGWLHLFRIDPESGAVSRRAGDRWQAWTGAGLAAAA